MYVSDTTNKLSFCCCQNLYEFLHHSTHNTNQCMAKLFLVLQGQAKPCWPKVCKIEHVFMYLFVILLFGSDIHACSHKFIYHFPTLVFV